jgi:hypothetical protein
MSESVVYDVICGFSALLMSAKWRRRARAAGGRVGGDVEVIDAEDSREPGVGARRPRNDECVRVDCGIAAGGDDRGIRALRLIREVEAGEILGRIDGRVVARGGHGSGSVRQVLRAGECGSVGGSLQLALGVVRIRHIDRECRDAEKRRQCQHDDWQNLSALPRALRMILRMPAWPSDRELRPGARIRPSSVGVDHPVEPMRAKWPECQPTTTTATWRGPCAPVTRIFSMSEVALAPVTNVIARGTPPS